MYCLGIYNLKGTTGAPCFNSITQNTDLGVGVEIFSPTFQIISRVLQKYPPLECVISSFISPENFQLDIVI